MELPLWLAVPLVGLGLTGVVFLARHFFATTLLGGLKEVRSELADLRSDLRLFKEDTRSRLHVGTGSFATVRDEVAELRRFVRELQREAQERAELAHAEEAHR